MSVEAQAPNGDAVRAIAALAKDATAALVDNAISPPEGAVGLPAKVPVLIKTGPTPEIVSLRLEIEKWRTAPERRAGTAAVQTLRSFIELTARHKDADSVIFAQTNWPNPSLTAVIDYHQTDGVARFGKHRIAYPFPCTREFTNWVNRNGKPFSQSEFAEFIEDNIMDLSVPLDGERTQYEALFRTQFAVPTDLVELASGLQVAVNSKVKSTYKTRTGESEIAFETTHTGANGEPLHVPGLFMLSFRAFVDGAELRLPARLRYRLKEGALTWSYQLYKWEDALRDRIAADLALAARDTGLPSFEGAPEA